MAGFTSCYLLNPMGALGSLLPHSLVFWVLLGLLLLAVTQCLLSSSTPRAKGRLGLGVYAFWHLRARGVVTITALSWPCRDAFCGQLVWPTCHPTTNLDTEHCKGENCPLCCGL
jgi:hypothetical protein